MHKIFKNLRKNKNEVPNTDESISYQETSSHAKEKKEDTRSSNKEVFPTQKCAHPNQTAEEPAKEENSNTEHSHTDVSENEVSNSKDYSDTPSNILELDIASVKTLQVGYQAESIFLKSSDSDKLVLKEYIHLDREEYHAKVTSNRIKTTIRYGRREQVDPHTYVELFLPKNWHGELLLSTQYGHISSEEDWAFERFAAETSEGTITLKTIKAPRIRILSSVSPIQVEHTIGFTDLHSVSGPIIAKRIDGGAKLETSSASVYASFTSLNNILECNTLNGNIALLLPPGTGMKVDGISKTGTITSDIEELEIKTRPGNIKNIVGTLFEKPFQNVRISTINGDVSLQYSEI